MLTLSPWFGHIITSHISEKITEFHFANANPISMVNFMDNSSNDRALISPQDSLKNDNTFFTDQVGISFFFGGFKLKMPFITLHTAGCSPSGTPL